MFLESLGADAAVHRLFEPYAARGLTLARVAVSQRDRYRLLTEAGELTAEASGALWYRTPGLAGMPVTGDWVAARVVDPSVQSWRPCCRARRRSRAELWAGAKTNSRWQPTSTWSF